MSILNANPTIKELKLKLRTYNCLNNCGITDLADILTQAGMTLQQFLVDHQTGELKVVVELFEIKAKSAVGLRRFGNMARADLLAALKKVHARLQASLFSNLVAADDEREEASSSEPPPIPDEILDDDSFDDLDDTEDDDIEDSESDLPFDTLLIGNVVTKGGSANTLNLEEVILQLIDEVAEDNALVPSPDDAHAQIAEYIRHNGWPVPNHIYVPAAFAREYRSILHELSRAASVVITATI
ncbi:MAG: hypothetical protein ACW99U_18395 [Candidatus Thorarchaeota archaeon]|jgi:hypothetical protein